MWVERNEEYYNRKAEAEKSAKQQKATYIVIACVTAIFAIITIGIGI